MIKDLNKLERVLDTLQEQSMMLMFQDKKEQSDDIEDAIKCLRQGFVRANEKTFFRHFRIFDKNNCWDMEEFIEDHVFVCHHLGLAVRKFNGQYYAVKIQNMDSYLFGVLTTDAPDNYPMHSFPEDIIHSEYPEIVMLKVIENYERKQEEAEG